MDAVFDSAQALRIVGGRAQLLGKLLRIFVGEYEEMLSAIKKSVDANDVEQVMSSAHRIAGALRILCATRASEIAMELETCGRENRLENVKALFDSLETETGLFVSTIEQFPEYHESTHNRR